MAGRPAGIPAAIDGVLELSAASWSGGAGGETATGRRDSSGSEEAVLCRGERRGELSGHTEHMGTAGSRARVWSRKKEGEMRRREKKKRGKRKREREKEKEKKRGRKKRKRRKGRRRDSRRRSRAGRGVDEKRCARETRKTGKKLDGD